MVGNHVIIGQQLQVAAIGSRSEHPSPLASLTRASPPVVEDKTCAVGVEFQMVKVVRISAEIFPRRNLNYDGTRKNQA